LGAGRQVVVVGGRAAVRSILDGERRAGTRAAAHDHHHNEFDRHQPQWVTTGAFAAEVSRRR